MLKGNTNMKIVKVSVHERRHPRVRYTNRTNGRCDPKIREYQTEMGEYNGPTRVYVYPTTYSVMENLVNRRERSWRDWKPLVQQELADAGITGKVRWSQYAGCKSCPCSPGFVLDTMVQLDGTPIDVSITIQE